jgi:hypothetical protein
MQTDPEVCRPRCAPGTRATAVVEEGGRLIKRSVVPTEAKAILHSVAAYADPCMSRSRTGRRKK